jgi:hypothetical protein
MGAFLPALVILGLILGLWGAARSARRPSDPTGEGGRASGWVRVFLALVVVWLVVEILAVRTLGTNANNTFDTAPRESRENK